MADGKKSSFAIWVTAFAVVLLVGIVWLVMSMNSSLKGESTPVDEGSANAGATEVVQVYADFMCGACKSFEEAFEADRDQLKANGTVRVDLVPVAILDSGQTDNYSTRAANAAFCVADENPAGVTSFAAELFDKQPTTVDQVPTNDDLIAIAATHGAENATACINELQHEETVKKNTRSLPRNPETGKRGTPTVTLNGKYIATPDFMAQLPELLAK